MRKVIMISAVLILYSSFTNQIAAQFMPETAVELYQKSVLTGIRPDNRFKEEWAMALDIRKKAEERSQNFSVGTVRDKMSSILRGLGYSGNAVEKFQESFKESHKQGLDNSFQTISDDFALEWSGNRPVFTDQRLVVKDYGEDHRKYDPSNTFWQDSDFEANNPKKLDATFKFDYLMSIKIEAGVAGTYRIALHVNSKDGSMGFEGNDAKRLIGARGGGQVDFVVLKKGGGGISFIRNRDGEMQANMLDGFPMIANAIDGMGDADADGKKNEEFMAHWNDWLPQTISGIDSRWRGDYNCVKGRYTHDHTTAICFGNEKPEIKTLVPNLGFGVGIFKDYHNEINKLIVYRESVGTFGMNLKVYLEDFKPHNFNFIGSRYNGKRHYDTRTTRDEIRRLERRIAQIERNMANANANNEEALKRLRDQKIACNGERVCLDGIATMIKQENIRHRNEMRRLNNQLEPLDERIKEVRQTGE